MPVCSKCRFPGHRPPVLLKRAAVPRSFPASIHLPLRGPVPARPKQAAFGAFEAAAAEIVRDEQVEGAVVADNEGASKRTILFLDDFRTA
jgi:hypothetical protein